MNRVITGDSQEVDPSYLAEVDQSLAEDTKKALDLPSVPITVPSAGKEEERKGIMELAWCVWLKQGELQKGLND